MTTEFLLILMAGALAGGFINGLAGFGTALLSLGFWLQILPAKQAVSMVVFMSVVSGIQGVWVIRHDILRNPRRLGRFLIPGLLGLPIGVALLNVISVPVLKMTIALFMLLYGGFFTLRRNLPKFERPTPIMDLLIGFAGGILGGAASLSGVLPTMWCAMRSWTKGEVRAVLQPYNVGILGTAMVFFAFQGNYDRETLMLILLTLPATLIGAQVGLMVFHRLGDQQFRKLLIGLMFVSGILMMINEMT